MSFTDRHRALLGGCQSMRVRLAVWPVLDTVELTWGTIISYDKRPHVVQARWEVYKALHDIGMSASQIGRIVGRDHTTVLHGLKRLAK